MAENTTYQAQANDLSQKLWAIANELRGNMDASKFKNYILGTIFYRYLSERLLCERAYFRPRSGSCAFSFATH